MFGYRKRYSQAIQRLGEISMELYRAEKLNQVQEIAYKEISACLEEERKNNLKLREALEEYAANENYERVANEPDIYEGGYSQPTWEPSWIEFDKGETARKALAGD